MKHWKTGNIVGNKWNRRGNGHKLYRKGRNKTDASTAVVHIVS